jgi:sialate O-acetylesterase
MAVAIDLGEWNDIHPLNKKDVSGRLVRAALKVAYGHDAVVHSGPVFRSQEIHGNSILLRFSDIGNGLIVKGGGKLKQFAIAGKDGRFVRAEAEIAGPDQVIVSGGAVPHPVAVRYAWADNPEGANLYNSEGLPAAPFRTDSCQASDPVTFDN